MFKIIGSDGKEYGPVATEKLREWLRQGRINGQTKVQPEGSADWRSLRDVAEFAADLAGPAASTPGALPPPPTGPVQGSKMAVWSLVLGILGFFTFGLTAVAGLVLGIVALVKIKGSQGGLTGSGKATAGIVTSGIALFFVPIIAILLGLLLPALSQAKSKAMSINCMNNLKQLALGVRMYSSDNKDTFPVAAKWCDAINSYVGTPRVFVCPTQPTARCSYAFNTKLAGLTEDKVNPQTVLIFESDAGWNGAGGAELAVPHHKPRLNVAFADGHVELVAAEKLKDLRWEP
jgi:prepilin-type processing-associated H-X9-DG protein